VGGFGAGSEFSWQALLGSGIQVAYQGGSVASIFKGCEEAGVPNNTALIFSELMESKSLFLTANADTVYFWVNLDVTNGPIVVETPPLALGVVDDTWFQWVTDFGLPGPATERLGVLFCGQDTIERFTNQRPPRCRYETATR
jgi:uncharacterized protein DUF1254